MTYAPPPSYPAAAPAPTYASWISRVGGYFVDAIPSWVLTGIGYAFGGPSMDPNKPHGPSAIYYVFALLSFVYAVWNRWYLGGTTGQTIGRKALGIKLVDVNTGQPIGVGKAFLRDICHAVDSIACFIGWLAPLWDAKKQTFADKIMSTVVVSVSR